MKAPKIIGWTLIGLSVLTVPVKDGVGCWRCWVKSTLLAGAGVYLLTRKA